MIPLSAFPGLNASLNAASAALLLAGWVMVRTGRLDAHRRFMTAAFSCSAVFLACYLWYHAHAGSTRFTRTGPIRTVYFSILLSHTVLAVVILPLILRTIFLARAGRFEEHRRWARWTFPLWLYVSATGVVVYGLLYRL